MWPDLANRGGKLEIGHIIRRKLTGGQSQTAVDAVRTGVGTNGIALVEVADGADHRPAYQGVGMGPGDWDGIDAERVGVGG